MTLLKSSQKKATRPVPRAGVVRGRLEVMARSAGVGARLPKAGDLCRDLSISRRTLDEALGELECSGIIKRTRGVGIFVTGRPTLDNHILLLCHPDFFNVANHSPFWRLLVRGAQQRATQSGGQFDIHFCRPDGVEPSLAPVLQNIIEGGQVAGVLSVGLRTEVVRELEKWVPVVSLAGWSSHIVGFDILAFMHQAIDCLRSLGCQRLALWHGYAPFQAHVDPQIQEDAPLRVFNACMSEQALDSRKELNEGGQQWLDKETLTTLVSLEEQGVHAVQRHYLDLPIAECPDGIICSDELLTQGVWRALSEANVQDTVKIVTHSNAHSPVLRHCLSDVYQLQYDADELVQAMFDSLDALITDESVPAVQALAPHLIPPQISSGSATFKL